MYFFHDLLYQFLFIEFEYKIYIICKNNCEIDNVQNSVVYNNTAFLGYM